MSNTKFESDNDIIEWTTSVKQFIKNNYYVSHVTLDHVICIFNMHGGFFSVSTLKNTFYRKNNRRPPTKKMQDMFVCLQGYASSKTLHPFYDLPLRHENRTRDTIFDPQGRYLGDVPRSEIKGRREGDI